MKYADRYTFVSDQDVYVRWNKAEKAWAVSRLPGWLGRQTKAMLVESIRLYNVQPHGRGFTGKVCSHWHRKIRSDKGWYLRQGFLVVDRALPLTLAGEGLCTKDGEVLVNSVRLDWTDYLLHIKGML